MLPTLNRPAVAGSSIFSFATRTRPAISAASLSIVGASIRQGPHHGAHKSTSTGNGERSTSPAKVLSVTTTGPTRSSSAACIGRRSVALRWRPYWG